MVDVKYLLYGELGHVQPAAAGPGPGPRYCAPRGLFAEIGSDLLFATCATHGVAGHHGVLSNRSGALPLRDTRT